MALSAVNRLRIAMDLIKDGNVASEVAYANVDLLDAPTALKYAVPVVTVYHGPTDGTNEEKAAFVLAQLRLWFADALRSSRVPAAANAAAVAETATVAAEVAAEI